MKTTIVFVAVRFTAAAASLGIEGMAAYACPWDPAAPAAPATLELARLLHVERAPEEQIVRHLSELCWAHPYDRQRYTSQDTGRTVDLRRARLAGHRLAALTARLQSYSVGRYPIQVNVNPLEVLDTYSLCLWLHPGSDAPDDPGLSIWYQHVMGEPLANERSATVLDDLQATMRMAAWLCQGWTADGGTR